MDLKILNYGIGFQAYNKTLQILIFNFKNCALRFVQVFFVNQILMKKY